MKKHFISLLSLVALMFTAVSFTACGDDNKEEIFDQELLAGYWDLRHFAISYKGQTYSDDVEPGMEMFARLYFSNDGQIVSYSYDTETKAFQQETTGSWQLSGSKLRITEVDTDGETESNTFTIRQLDDTTLRIKLKDADFYQDDDIVGKADLELTFSRAFPSDEPR